MVLEETKHPNGVSQTEAQMNTKKKYKKNTIIISLLILVMVGIAGCGTLEVGALPVEAVSGNNESIGNAGIGDQGVGGIEIGIEPTPMPGKLSYTNDTYGFEFDYPETWTLSEIDHGVVLMKDTNRLGIHFRWINENIDPSFGRTGMAAGTPIYSYKINFMDQILPESTVELDGLVKYVIYGDMGSQIEIDDLAFVIVLEDLESDYMTLDMPDEVIAEARSILESFRRIEASGSPPEGSEMPQSDGAPPALMPVVAWLGHIASLPEGSRFDDMVMLSPEGTGEFGLIGATPEIEAEIVSLRDADGPNEYDFFWGVLTCGVDDYNNCQLSVDRLQYGANYSEEPISDWFGTIKSATFNGGPSYVFELEGYFPMWYSINASQDQALRSQIEAFLQSGEVVEVSGTLMVGVPDVNGTRIEVSSIQARSETGMPRPDIVDGLVYENQAYGFTFQYPSYMTVVEESNRALVNNGTLQLTIAYRRAEEDIQLSDFGELTGQFHPYTSLQFLGQAVEPSLNIHEGRITAVYLGGPGVELGEGTPLRFMVSLINTDGTWISNAQVDEMLQIFQNFALMSQND
jgi:hypothetical protein